MGITTLSSKLPLLPHERPNSRNNQRNQSSLTPKITSPIYLSHTPQAEAPGPPHSPPRGFPLDQLLSPKEQILPYDAPLRQEACLHWRSRLAAACDRHLHDMTHHPQNPNETQDLRGATTGTVSTMNGGDDHQRFTENRVQPTIGSTSTNIKVLPHHSNWCDYGERLLALHARVSSESPNNRLVRT